MKHVITLATVAALTLAATARAQTELSVELRTIQTGYEAAVHSALAPINQQHATHLLELLKRAQAAGDKQATLETLTELRKLGPAAIQYTAKVVFEFTTSNEVNGEQVIRNHLPNDPFISTLTEVRNTGLFELTVTAADPKFAAARANDLATALQRSIAARGTFPAIKIWEHAEPPDKPVATN